MKKQHLTFTWLPNSAEEPLLITSSFDGTYNCIAWALGMTKVWFWPDHEGDHKWPADLPRIESIEIFIQFFQKHGFEVCKNEQTEKGFEKIALFQKNGIPTHACRLLKKGVWTSKIGALEDVQHSLFAISGGWYGEVSIFLKRKIVKT